MPANQISAVFFLSKLHFDRGSPQIIKMPSLNRDGPERERENAMGPLNAKRARQPVFKCSLRFEAKPALVLSDVPKQVSVAREDDGVSACWHIQPSVPKQRSLSAKALTISPPGSESCSLQYLPFTHNPTTQLVFAPKEPLSNIAAGAPSPMCVAAESRDAPELHAAVCGIAGRHIVVHPLGDWLDVCMVLLAIDQCIPAGDG